jgi:sugar O-acyltransferase (sialic acid O-acetyltransferase NeuD family)
MREKILLIGGGGHCKSCIDVIELEGNFEIVGIIDRKELIGQKLLGYQIIGCDDDLSSFLHVRNALVTIGQIESPQKRIRVFDLINSIGFNSPIIVSPLAYLSKYAEIGKGSIIMHNALVNAGAKIGANCIINSKALVEHDAVIEDHCHIATAAVINGGVKVRKGTFWGSGAVGKQNVETAESSFIKANSIFRGSEK